MTTKFYQKPNNLQEQHLNVPIDRQDGQQRLQINQNIDASQPMFPVIAASSHPLVSLVHIVLKIAVVAIYVVFPLFSSSFLVKEIVVILAAIDFWIVKNIVGRLLVGLRWWVDFNQNGDQKWRFQGRVDDKSVNPADDKVFWWTLGIFCLAWLLLCVANVLSLNITNLIICIFCLVMLIFNFYSYYRCSKAKAQNIKKLAVQYGVGMAARFMTGSIIGNYF